jgi:formylglycine-generating enzyme required for sulfatase activity
MPSRIFISYASEDASVADRVRTGLEQAGVACWIAPRDIEPGTSFPAAITAAIHACSAQVLLLTAEANVSRHVLSEVELAFNAGKPILAVLVGNVTPSSDLQYFISTTHWFDAEASFDDDDLAQLKVDLDRLLAGERIRIEANRGRQRRRNAAIAGAAAVAVIAVAVYLTRLTEEPAARPPTKPDAHQASPQPTPASPAPAPAVTREPPVTQPAAPLPAPTAVLPAPPAARPRTKVSAADGQTYLWIPPGSFAMGCSSGDGDCQPDEMPVHTVRIERGFWLARTEVTNAQYEKRMPLERAEGTTSAHPAVGMSWPEAKAYCAMIGGRLPTEAEWEYAARAGSRERYYDTLSSIAWYEGNSSDRSHQVGQKVANAYGLHDMLGNVYEWVLDRYYNKYDDTTAAVEEPLAPNATAVARGGAWHSEAKDVRVSNRFGAPKDYADLDTGFRCAMNGP